MSAQLTLTPVQKFFDNNGAPLAFGLLFSYVAGTTTKQATYVDSTQTTPNTNPIVLNARGEAQVWLDLSLTYKFTLSPSTDTDPPTNAFWTVDQVPGAGGLTQNLIGSIIYPRTSAEIAAGITPSNYIYPPGDIRRFGGVADFGATDNSTFVQTAINSFGVNGGVVFITKGCKWNYNSITPVNEVDINDQSGWDYANSQWNSSLKWFMQTLLPNTKNANEWDFLAPYGPGIVLDNLGTDKQCRLVFRQNGISKWGVAKSISTDDQFVIFGYKAGPSQTTRYSIGDGNSASPGNHGFNSAPVAGIDQFRQSGDDQRTMVIRTRSNTGGTSNYDIQEQYYRGDNTQLCTTTYSGTTQDVTVTPLGKFSFGSAVTVKESATAPVTAGSGTIATAGLGTSRVAPAGNIASVILAAGTKAGQTVTVVNEANFTITFAASGTSNVADGVSDVIAALTARQFYWDSGTSLWYRCG